MLRTAAPGLYERDYALWIEQQVGVLRDAVRDGRLRGLDVENVIEELEGLARSERSSLRSHLTTLSEHLLKFYGQPSMATWHWLGSVNNAATAIREIFKELPSLEAREKEYFPKAYADARRQAHIETHLAIETFPETPTAQFDRAYKIVVFKNGGLEPILDELELIVRQAGAERKSLYSRRRGKRRIR